MDSYNKTKDIGVYHVMASVTEYILQASGASPQPQFQVNLAPSYTPRSVQDRSGSKITYIFINLCLGLIPALFILLFVVLADRRESQIYQLSKSMGLRDITLVVTGYLMVILTIILVWIPMFFALKYVIVKKGNLLIVFLSVFISSVAQYQQTVFLGKSSGTLGIVLLVLLYLGTNLIQLVYVKNPPPGYITYPLSVLSPGYGSGLIMHAAIDFEVRFDDGLQWNNMNTSYYNNSPLITLLCLTGSLCLFAPLLVWLWPVFNEKEGKRPPLCYCCNSEYKKAKRKKRARMGKIRQFDELNQDQDLSNLMLEEDGN